MPVRNVSATPRPPLPSTTLMLLRRGRAGLEVLMLRRILRAAFGGAWVFPGGMLDDQDRDRRLYRRCLGLNDDRASRLLALPGDGLAYWVGAIRETLEEAGLLIAVNGCGQARRRDDSPRAFSWRNRRPARKRRQTAGRSCAPAGSSRTRRCGGRSRWLIRHGIFCEYCARWEVLTRRWNGRLQRAAVPSRPPARRYGESTEN